MGDAAYIYLEIEALHRRAREMPGQTARYGSPAEELIGQERMDFEDSINLVAVASAQLKPSAAMRCSTAAPAIRGASSGPATTHPKRCARKRASYRLLPALTA